MLGVGVAPVGGVGKRTHGHLEGGAEDPSRHEIFAPSLQPSTLSLECSIGFGLVLLCTCVMAGQNVHVFSAMLGTVRSTKEWI
jgi:hypothetical protein